MHTDIKMFLNIIIMFTIGDESIQEIFAILNSFLPDMGQYFHVLCQVEWLPCQRLSSWIPS